MSLRTYKTEIVCAFALTATLVSAIPAAYAADLGGPSMRSNGAAANPLTPVIGRHFYVRGDVGIGRHSLGSFSQSELATNGGSFISQSIGDTVIIGAGLGVQVDRRFRVDLTGEYRSTSTVKALDNLSAALSDPDGSLQANTLYHGNLSTYVGLLNGYVDLFNWRGFTPYVGAGIGIARVALSDFTTTSSATFTETETGLQANQLSNGVAGSATKTNLAWALMIGTSYDLSQNAKLDLGYRYLNMGRGASATSGVIDCVCGPSAGPLKISDLESHEFRIGVRWSLGEQPKMMAHSPSK
jgi:opacity protein-like surface antigen